jgi:hypothetical protein
MKGIEEENQSRVRLKFEGRVALVACFSRGTLASLAGAYRWLVTLLGEFSVTAPPDSPRKGSVATKQNSNNHIWLNTRSVLEYYVRFT